MCIIYKQVLTETIKFSQPYSKEDFTIEKGIEITLKPLSKNTSSIIFWDAPFKGNRHTKILQSSFTETQKYIQQKQKSA